MCVHMSVCVSLCGQVGMGAWHLHNNAGEEDRVAHTHTRTNHNMGANAHMRTNLCVRVSTSPPANPRALGLPIDTLTY
jgi:hypothetical protein